MAPGWKTCETCAAWDGEGGVALADCRRRAPRLIDDEQYDAVWPRTAPHDWCLEWEDH